jgi:methyl-accepting chemotaxis protein
MIELIKRKLSLKVALALALITIPPVLIAGYLITSRQTASLEKLTLDSAKIAVANGAKMYSATLEAGIDTGMFTVSDVLEPAYEPISGLDFGDKPKFHTAYDFYTDREVAGFQDKILESSPDFLFAVGVDRNGYLPTHNSKNVQALTGDRDKDLVGNRTKRKFANPVEIAAAKNLEPVLVQEYHRDTGEVAWDVSSPIYVKGQHYGGFRLGVSISSLTEHKHNLMVRLSLVFGLLLAVTVGFIFLMLRRSMKPLEDLTARANQLSIGENLDQAIKPGTTDEIGQMAKSMNRLRASLAAAMGRLGE